MGSSRPVPCLPLLYTQQKQSQRQKDKKTKPVVGFESTRSSERSQMAEEWPSDTDRQGENLSPDFPRGGPPGVPGPPPVLLGRLPGRNKRWTPGHVYPRPLRFSSWRAASIERLQNRNCDRTRFLDRPQHRHRVTPEQKFLPPSGSSIPWVVAQNPGRAPK